MPRLKTSRRNRVRVEAPTTNLSVKPSTPLIITPSSTLPLPDKHIRIFININRSLLPSFDSDMQPVDDSDHGGVKDVVWDITHNVRYTLRNAFRDVSIALLGAAVPKVNLQITCSQKESNNTVCKGKMVTWYCLYHSHNKSEETGDERPLVLSLTVDEIAEDGSINVRSVWLEGEDMERSNEDTNDSIKASKIMEKWRQEEMMNENC